MRIGELEAKRFELEQQISALSESPRVPAIVGSAEEGEARGQLSLAAIPVDSTNEEVRQHDGVTVPKVHGRHLVRVQLKMSLRVKYKDLASELHLSSMEAEQLFDLLARQQIEQARILRETRGDSVAASQATMEHKWKYEREFMGLLGAKYSKYLEYERSVMERMRIEHLSGQFAAANMALGSLQKKHLLSAMIEANRSAPKMPVWDTQASRYENLVRRHEWRRDHDRHIRNQLVAVLSTSQIEEYDKIQSAYAEMSALEPSDVRMTNSAYEDERG